MGDFFIISICQFLIIIACCGAYNAVSHDYEEEIFEGSRSAPGNAHINSRINDMNFNNIDNNYDEDDAHEAHGDNDDKYERGVARLSQASVESNALFNRFFGRDTNYSKYVLPKQRIAGRAVTVKLLLTLTMLGDVDEKNQIMSTMIWVNHEWQDVNLSWDPKEYGGLTELHIPSDFIWIPDTVLYNNADGDYQLSNHAKVSVHYSGIVRWEPPTIYRSFCLIDVTYFPFDDQACDLKLGPWTFDVHVVNYVHLRAPDVDFLIDAIDRGRYFESVEWEVIAVPGKRNEVYYTGLTEGYVDITYTVLLRRKPLFYTIYLIAPCLAISLLTIFVFYLPTETGEKVTLSISILLSLTFFINLLADLVPPTSLIIPLIGKYLLFTMVLVTFSTISTVAVLAVFKKDIIEPPPEWVRFAFLKVIPKFLFMKLRPIKKSPELLRLEFAFHAEDCRTRSRYAGRHNELGHFKDFDKDFYHRHQPGVFKPPAPKRDEKVGGAYYENESVWQKPKHHPPPFFASTARRMLEQDSRGLHHHYDFTKDMLPENEEELEKELKEELIRNTLLDVANIVEHTRQQEMDELLRREWETIARVLDRLFLVLYSASCIFGILSILLSAPSLWGVEHKALADFRKLAEQYPSFDFNETQYLPSGAKSSFTSLKI